MADCGVLWGLFSGLSDRGVLDDEGPLRWGSGTVLEDWAGVTVVDGRVTGLELSDLGLSGSLPAALGSLSALVTLDLSWSGLSGPVPAALGSLSSLEVLRLNNNSLTGEVPAALGSLGSLRVLEVGANSLSGEVPAALGSLSSLEVLRLDANSFTGSIPAELGSLSSLGRLDLWGNSLSGPIPAQLGDLGSLVTLELGANMLSGAMPAELGDLGSLVTLGAGHNMLSGALPAELGSLGSLETLNLDHNSLSGAIPPGLGGLQSLSRLSLAANSLSGPIPPEMGDLGSLEILNLADNDLSGPIPAALGGLASLLWLSVANNSLTGPIPPELGGVASLRHLSLAANPLSWPPPASLAAPRGGLNVRLPTQWAPAAPAAPAAAPGVDRLTVTWDPPAGSTPYTVASYTLYWRRAGTTARFARADTTTESATIAGLTGGQAYELHVTATNHTGTSPPSAAITATPLETPCGQTTTVDQTRTSLIADCEALWAWRRSLTDATAVTSGTGAWDDTNTISAWTGVTVTNNRVTELDLSGSGVAGPIAAELGNLTALTTLDLSDNNLTGDMPATVGSLTALTELDLSFNALTGAIPTQLGSLTSLEVLDLAANALTGAIPTQLGSLTALEVLDVAGNNHTGAIPTQLSSLTSLEVLRLSGELTGSIPTQLGSLTNLEVLHIGSDTLTGAIPTQLSSLASLDTLYISGANISGSLPAELGALTNLETLWIKSDSLTGAIPARYADLTSLTTLYVSGGGLTGPVPAWLSGLTSLERLYLHNNTLSGPIPAGVGSLNNLTTLWLAGNDLTGTIPAALGSLTTLDVLDLRHNHLTWPPPAGLADPAEGLTVLLPDTADWVPPAPSSVTTTAGNATIEVAWEHPGAGTDYLVDTYTVNHRTADSTGGFTQTTATASPVTIDGLTNGTDYHIFVTATSTAGTSIPSTTVTAAPAAAAEAQAGGYPDIDTTSGHGLSITRLDTWDLFDDTLDTTHSRCSGNNFCPYMALQRWQMAVWLTRALARGEPPATSTAPFSDVAGYRTWWGHINYFKTHNITTGCTPDGLSYCPDRDVTRAHMASFLARAFGLNDGSQVPDAGFTDVNDRGAHAESINRIAALGITTGCTPDRLSYCPNRSVTRAQMATFILRACDNTNTNCTPRNNNGNGGGNTGGSGGGSGGGTTTPTGPSAPTIEDPVPGPGSITITWQRNTADKGRTITRWQILPSRIHYVTNNLGTTTPVATPLTPRTVNVTDGTAAQHTHTIEELEFNTEYRIQVRGYFGTTAGTYSDPKTATTPQEAVKLVALEVTQGLQNWNGDITLVKGKPTVVRAFLEPARGTEAQVDVRLQAVVNGQIVATAAPRNPDIQVVPPMDYNEHLFTARDGAAARRAVLGASANFLLDLDVPGTRQEWVGSPSGQPNLSLPGSRHSVTYRLVVDDGVICAAAAAQTDNSAAPGTACRADLEFRFVKTPTVRMVGIGYVDDKGNTVVPSRGDLEEQAQRILSAMPIPDLDYDLRHLNHTYSTSPSLDPTLDPPLPDPLPEDLPLLTRLLLARATDATTRVYLGVLPGNGGGRAIDILGNVAAWYTDGTEDEEAFGYARNRGAHEFGHVVGHHHTLDNNDKIICRRDPKDPGYTPVAPATGAAYPKYPYMEMTTDGYRALLGSTGAGTNDEVWGFDARFVRPNSAARGTIDRLAVINPAEVFALMSYCGQTIGDTQARWVDRLYHGLFMVSINSINWQFGPVAGSEGTVDPLEPTHHLFSGFTTTAADGSSSETVLLPVFEVDAAVTSAEPSAGGYVLELLDGDAAVVRSVRFDAQTVVADASGGSETTGDVFEVWAVSVPGAPDYASVRVRRRSLSGQMSMVAEAARSASAPTVSITVPAAGQVLSGETVQISWTAADVDGDDLSHLVQYSTDGGATYETLAAGHPTTSLSLPRRLLAGSGTARVRVVASDGLRTASAVSALFTVAANAPEVRIESPAEAAVYGGHQPLALKASAYDTEDGALGASALSWSSSLNGALGTGAHLVIDTSRLTAGTHTLTATAVDSDDTTASAAVTVTVNTGNEFPAAADDIALTRVGAELLVDVLANDTDPEADVNLSTLRVAVPAAAGRAQSASDGRVGYSAAEAGYDAFVYKVCDRANQCATAEVTVIAISDR